jgi:glycerol-3-phosphate dehydrogenase subunit B
VRGDLRYDAVVIGAGTAGLTAATRLAEHGARVCVLAQGVGSTHLAPGTIDILGYAPEAVSEPLRALPAFAAQRPEHPYARVGAEVVSEALQWFRARAAAGPLPGYRYVGSPDRNLRLPSAVGALRPSALVPETMAGGDAGGEPRVCVVGVRALRDFHPGLCAANLSRAGLDARALELEIPFGRADQNALGLARRFDDPAWRAAFCAELALRLHGEERVALPAVLGLRQPHATWRDLEDRLGRPVFEIPTLPPSVPGMRLFELLRAALRRAGSSLVLGAEVVGAERTGGRVLALHARSAGGERRYRADWVVLASGGFHSGAIELDSRWQAHERVLGLELAGVPAPGEPRFVARYLDEQPLHRAGVALEDGLRARGVENVLVAGAALPGAAAWREGSGEGIALATGSAVAAQITGARMTVPTQVSA